MNRIGYLIYAREEGIQNQAFISMFQQAGKRYSITFQMVDKREYLTAALPDFVINRTRDPQVSRWYEAQGIKTFHTETVVRLGNDKAEALRYLEETLPDSVKRRAWSPRGFVAAPGQYKTATEWLAAIRDRIGSVREVVLKTVDGHGGSEVFLLPGDPDTNWQYWELVCRKYAERKLLCQERVETDRKDLRVYVLGGKIYAAVLRQGQKDFRSNYSLGGQVKSFDLTPRQQAYVRCFIKAFGAERLAMVGLDFLVGRNGEFVFNELEEMVGSRMLYRCSHRDIVADYVAWLHREISHTDAAK